jgi:hypothetical protein
MKKIFTREDAILFLNCNPNAKPHRIIEGLEKHGFKNIEKVGRGQKTSFICEQPNDTDEQCYYMFKDILINEYGYGKNFDYNKALSIIDFHINNKEFLSLENIAEHLELSVKTLQRHRQKLKGKILKEKEQCKQQVVGHNSENNIDENITDLYYDSIMLTYSNTIKQLIKDYGSFKNSSISIFKNRKNNSFTLMRNDENVETFETVKETMNEQGNKWMATYPLWIYEDEGRKLNEFLKQRLFYMILKENGYDYVFFLRLYEITEDLKNDEEFLDIIKRAIKYNSNK